MLTINDVSLEKRSLSMAGALNNSERIPTFFAKSFGNEQIAVRFEQIGSKARFKSILGRFRDEFPLAKYQELDNRPSWIISVSQHDKLVDFCRRYGLRLSEDK